MANLLSKVVRFSTKTEYVRHEAHFNVSAADAFKICMDYAAFLEVMLSDQKDPPRPEWIKGGPGQVGAQVRYKLEREGSTNIIVEEVTELSIDKTTGAHTLAWKNISSEPFLPLKEYGCTWVLQPATDPATDGPLCHLIWTRHFKEPKILGLVSLGNYMKDGFRRTGGTIMNFVFRAYYAREFPPADRRLPHKGERVLVVGAGPSGLHMAHLLKNKVGIDDITIMELTDRHGGKTKSIPSATHEGVVHELGTCYLHPAYFAVRAYMQEIKQMPGCDLPGFAEEVEPLHYSIERVGKGNLTLNEWITSNLQVQPIFSLMAIPRIVLPWVDTEVELLDAKVHYNRLHEDIFGLYDYSMPPRLAPEVLARLDMSFGQFLQSHGLASLMPILAYGQTAQGYGSIENVPAFWAMCWITPQLLDGYFSLRKHALPKKAMFKIGWQSMWDMTIKVNDLKIEYNTNIKRIERTAVGPIQVTAEQKQADGTTTEIQREYDYLVVAAPLYDPIGQKPEKEPWPHELVPATTSENTAVSPAYYELTPTTKGQELPLPLDLTPTEKSILQSDTITASQFRTILFKPHHPQPYLDSHLELNADKVLGPQTGQGDVFASRDSYLALHPDYCNPAGHAQDPARGDLREQMAYQWVENDKNAPLSYFDNKFHQWAMDKFGVEKNYKVLTSPLWVYFQRYDRQGLKKLLPWKLLELQGRNRTLFVHASTFFESVLDIMNYNNMLVDGLSGQLNLLQHPESDKKPLYYQSDHWHTYYNRFTRAIFTVLNVILGTIWTILYLPFSLILGTTLIRYQRLRLQQAFKTENPGNWYQQNMKHFLKISPSIACYINDTEDPIVRDTKEILAQEHPEIPQVDKALMWSYADYRVAIRVWMDAINTSFLGFISPRMSTAVTWLRQKFPVTYNFLVSWGFVFSFNLLTGYSVRVEDEKGGGCYVPSCAFLKTARQEYGEELGGRICTHVCKIFTEEAMKRKGLDCTLEPNQEKGSCMIRAVPYQIPAYADHTIAYGMKVTPEDNNLQAAQGKTA